MMRYTRPLMAVLCLSLVLVSFALAVPFVWVAMQAGADAHAFDTPGAAGHVKELRKIPNIGGLGIMAAILLPLCVGFGLMDLLGPDFFHATLPGVGEHVAGVQMRGPLVAVLVGCLLLLHLVGLIDDRKALSPGVKSAAMLATAVAISLTQDTRLFTFLDPHVGGSWLSLALTVLWIVGITNAMNFIDNMDGLSAGVGAISSACFLVAALMHEQWFVAGCLALVVGALSGFLVFNFPPARVFMGDGGSLPIGFFLAFLTIRTTYYDATHKIPLAGGWYGVFMPLCVLGVPLYDLISVTVVRTRLGKSPFVGSPHHLSHRLTKLGLSKRDAVLVIYGLAAITGLSGVVLGSLEPWQAALVGVQVVCIFLAVAVFEWKTGSGTRA